MDWLTAHWQELLSVLGVIIAVYAYFAYIRSILWGPTRPHRVTWGGWSLVGILGLTSSSEGGAGIGLIVTMAFVAGVVLIFALSLLPKYGKPGGGRLDYVAGAVAAGALLTQLFVEYSPAVGATIAVTGDLVFLWPTLREAWLRPELEATRPWVIGAIAGTLGVVALGNYSYAASAYTIYILLGDLAIIAALIIRRPTGIAHTKKSRG